MGYYTNYKITVVHGECDLNEMAEAISKLSDYCFEARKGIIDSGDEIKWYMCTENMTEISKLYPNVVILVDGEGEEQGDIWKEYYFNGEGERIRGEISFAASKILERVQIDSMMDEQLKGIEHEDTT